MTQPEVSRSAGVVTAPAALADAPRPEERAAPVARVAVIGASGYSGQEFVRLASGHPGLALAALVSREHAGRPAVQWIPGLDPRATSLPAAVMPEALDAMLADARVDTLVACLPHGAWKALSAERPELARAKRVVDLSSDFRDGASGYVYGLPEQARAAIAAAKRIANPGCYATAAALALLPAAEAGWLDGPVMISALSGVSGAGRSAQLRTSYVELEGAASIYRAGTEHAHVPEIERALDRAGAFVSVGFVPQLAPMSRGILLTANAPLSRPVRADDVHAFYARRYAREPFVRVLDAGVWPETRAVARSNRCDVAVTVLHGGRTLLVAAALDNLVKGAAGQAIQNLNLMLGRPEFEGLTTNGSPW